MRCVFVKLIQLILINNLDLERKLERISERELCEASTQTERPPKKVDVGT